MYCVTSPKEDNRYREPPPTPPGYMGISLADIKEGSPHHPHCKPPDYSVAVQRSKMLPSKLARLSSAPLSSEPVACFPKKMPQWHSRQPSHPKLADMTDANSEEDGMLRSNLIAIELNWCDCIWFLEMHLTKITLCTNQWFLCFFKIVCTCVINASYEEWLILKTR